MSNVYLFALAGLNSARQAQVLAVRTVAIAYNKPAPPEPERYGPAPRDRVEITGGRGQPQAATYGPLRASGTPRTPAREPEAAAVQTLAARQAFSANAKVLEAHAKTQQALLDVTT